MRLSLLRFQNQTSQGNYRPVFWAWNQNSQPNTSKLNLATYKNNYTPQPSGIYPRNTRLV